MCAWDDITWDALLGNGVKFNQNSHSELVDFQQETKISGGSFTIRHMPKALQPQPDAPPAISTPGGQENYGRFDPKSIT